MMHGEREIKGTDNKIQVLKICKVLRVAFKDEKYPYVVPMNYGVSVEKENLVLYLHCAKSGKKLDVINRNQKVGFETDWFEEVETPQMHCRMQYQSIIGGGIIRVVDEHEECVKAANCILEHYNKKKIKRYSQKLFENIYMLRIDVVTYTGKQI